LCGNQVLRRYYVAGLSAEPQLRAVLQMAVEGNRRSADTGKTGMREVFEYYQMVQKKRQESSSAG